MDISLIQNMETRTEKIRIFWPASGDSSKKIRGPVLLMTESGHWIEEGRPSARYSKINELITYLADFEEAKRLKIWNDSFAASGI
tara:strand:- start:135791 stop:136045 length:255 start_codon:yes stop_codon:yes gene_type:complete